MFSSQLTRRLESFHLLKHPFYQAWMAGELSRDQLQNYALQYYPHVLAFPRYVSAVHSRCEDQATRKALAHNLADEEGIVGGTDHPELWVRFAEGMGAKREDVLARQSIAPAAQKLVDTFLELSHSSYAEGLAALYAYERQIPEIARSKIEGLKQRYDVHAKETLEFFEVHETADRYHSEACAKALDALPESDRPKAAAAAETASRALWDFLTEAYAVA